MFGCKLPKTIVVFLLELGPQRPLLSAGCCLSFGALLWEVFLYFLVFWFIFVKHPNFRTSSSLTKLQCPQNSELLEPPGILMARRDPPQCAGARLCPSTQGRQRQDDFRFGLSLSYMMRLCLNKTEDICKASKDTFSSFLFF